ncbi:MAG: alpha/beta hydrolase [Lactococcus chungangensis]|jgi:uncharacterized alpha/beta hydrolase family protein|uniref:Uncharacterized protein with an alpha/beta hydrolase fold n=2 Tax=Pseudolactococcus chungangensis CAU 28 = DSM 22330 TaxID=1122154 RepID=A0A1K2H5U8_9LACT|nr:alpha/beta hydrolase [Lactococcus chungangensis]NCB80866.1 alpha/beta hydrolase [Bacilli bacterium]SFZ71415.1 Uncharacterized protein with an alpha/beta hydrolase fold [Lactococcus chungangensis CAU 28 = DSM 22330]
MKNKIAIILSLLFMSVIAYYGHNWVINMDDKESKLRNSRLKPIIFIPGSNADINRFNSLISKLNNTEPKHSILKVQVNTDGSLDYFGSLNSKDLRPFIVIGFKNNNDGYSNIKKQYEWLNIAMNDLQTRYHFKNFQAIGHSNGGLIWTGFLENGYDEDKFQISDFMSLGTPYNFSETSPTRPTVILKEYIENKNKLPKNLSVYSIAGTEDYTDDGVVPVQSVMAGKYIFQKQVKLFTQITVSGEEAQHSNLPENDEVISLIQEYLLKTFKSKGKNNFNSKI